MVGGWRGGGVRGKGQMLVDARSVCDACLERRARAGSEAIATAIS